MGGFPTGEKKRGGVRGLATAEMLLWVYSTMGLCSRGWWLMDGWMEGGLLREKGEEGWRWR